MFRRLLQSPMHRHHETPHPWTRERTPWEPEPSAAGRAILREWLDHQLALIAASRRHHRLWPHRPPRSEKAEKG